MKITLDDSITRAESAQSKDSEIRIRSFEEIRSILSKYYYESPWNQRIPSIYKDNQDPSSITSVQTVGNWKELGNAAKKGIKRGGKEGELALDCLALISVSVEEGREDYRGEFVPFLKSLISDETIEAKLRGNAARTLAVVVLFTPRDHEDHDVEFFEYIRELVRRESDEGRDASFESGLLDSYSLLLTKMKDEYVYETVIPSDTQVLESFLHSGDENVALSAGIALAYFFNVGRKTSKEGFDFFKFTRYACDELHASDLKSTLHSLRGGNQKRISFDEIYDSIVEGKFEGEELKLSSSEEPVKFTEWKDFIILEEMRRISEIDLQFSNNQHFREEVLGKKGSKWSTNATPDKSSESKRRDKEIKYDREAKSKGLG